MAFAATMVWEVQTGGDDTNNGGGFDPTSGTPGTDRSQSATAFQSYSDLVIDGTTSTKMTSAAHPFSAADVGNVVAILSGTGFTVQRVQIMSVAANVATCDKSLGTLGSTGGVGNLGGALATPSKAFTLYIGGNTIYIKGGTYLCAALTLGQNAAANIATRVIGYQTTRADNGTKPILRASGISSTSILTISGYGHTVDNIDFDGNSLSGMRGVTASANHNRLLRCKGRNCPNAGFYLPGAACSMAFCEAANCTGVGIFVASSNSLYACVAHDTAGPGFQAAGGGYAVVDCISYNNTGGTGDGFDENGQAGAYFNCTAYNNAGSGFNLSSATFDKISYVNCLAAGNAGYGWKTGALVNNVYLLNCAGYSNTSGHYTSAQVPNVSSFQTLTASPFVSAGTDFSLNTTASGGAACRAAGIPGAFPGLSGTTGYLDIGAAQSQSLIIVLDD